MGIRADGDAHRQDHLRLPPPTSRLPASGAASPRLPHARTQPRSHTHWPRRADPARGPAPAPAGAPSGAHRPVSSPAGWREAAASGRFDFPAAPVTWSLSPSRGGGARSLVPSPAAARAETQEEASAPALWAPRSSRPTSAAARAPPAPHAPFLSCIPSAPARSRTPLSTAPRVAPRALAPRPSPAPLRLAQLRRGSQGTSPLSTGPPAFASQSPHPLLDPRPPLLPPPSLSHFPRPLFELLSPPFAAQPQLLLSRGRAHGFSCSEEGVNRPRVD